jgi:copper(I)-binding protein
MLRRILLAGTAAVIATSALAHDYELKALKIDHPFARATPAGAKVAGAFMTIQNTGTTADRLVSAASPVAGVVELHEMTMEGNVMKMRAVPGIEVPAGGKAELKPGGYHVMLMDLKGPLVEGKDIPLTLRFEKAGSVDVKVKIESKGSTGHKH